MIQLQIINVPTDFELPVQTVTQIEQMHNKIYTSEALEL